MFCQKYHRQNKCLLVFCLSLHMLLTSTLPLPGMNPDRFVCPNIYPTLPRCFLTFRVHLPWISSSSRSPSFPSLSVLSFPVLVSPLAPSSPFLAAAFLSFSAPSHQAPLQLLSFHSWGRQNEEDHPVRKGLLVNSRGEYEWNKSKSHSYR